MTQGDLPQAQERERASPASPSEEPERRRQRRKTLTDRMVAALPKKRERYSVPDPELAGHYVRVMPSGVKSYCASVRDPSQPATSKTTGRTYHKTVWHTLGSAEVLKIDEARDLARKAIKAIKGGQVAGRAGKAKPDSFRSVAENWIKRHVAESNCAPARDRALPEQVCFSPLGRARLHRHQAQRRCHAAGLHRGPSRLPAGRFGFGHPSLNCELVRHSARRLLSPFLRGMRRHKNGARARILDDSNCVRSGSGRKRGQFRRIDRTLLLTGQRRGAVLGMRWDDIDDDGVWDDSETGTREGQRWIIELPGERSPSSRRSPRSAAIRMSSPPRGATGR